MFKMYDEEDFDSGYHLLEDLIEKFGKLQHGMLVLDKLIGNGDSDNPLNSPIRFHCEKDEGSEMVIN